MILGCQWLCTLFAVLAADEAVARGAARGRAYAVAVVGASLVAAIAQYLIRIPLHLRTYVSGEELLVRITQPAVVFADQVIVCALATFVYVSVSTARDAAARRRSADIARIEARRRTLESKLAGDAGARRAAVPVQHARPGAPALRGRCRAGRQDARRSHRLPARRAAAPARELVDARQGSGAGPHLPGHRPRAATRRAAGLRHRDPRCTSPMRGLPPMLRCR